MAMAFMGFTGVDRGLLALAKRDFLGATGRTGGPDWERLDAAVDELLAEVDVDELRAVDEFRGTGLGTLAAQHLAYQRIVASAAFDIGVALQPARIRPVALFVGDVPTHVCPPLSGRGPSDL